MMELEERIVYSELVTFEPFEKVTDDGQPVDDRGSHGGGEEEEGRRQGEEGG